MGKGKAGPAAGLSVVAVVGIALLVKGLYPVDLPVSRNPDFIDNVFANRAVLIRMKNGEWLRRAGPFEISEGKLAQAEAEIDFWRQEALESEEKILALRKQLARTDELTANLPNRG
jgi:hypothetical protein